MKAEKLYENNDHTWIVFGRDEDKPDLIIDTNQYMVTSKKNSLLMDPGGVELFSAMLSAVIKEVPAQKITHLFASHQDPDIISSLGLWDLALTDATLHSPWLWEGYIRHFGMQHIEYEGIPDEGSRLTLDEVVLEFIPAHYLHSSGNFNVYDPKAKILMSGDIGAAMEEPDAPMFVEDFDAHIGKMKMFHQRWMPSNKAKNDWVRRVRQLDIEMMCPQHGRIFRGADVKRFLDWFENLEVGVLGGRR
ncbi:flavoprotein [Cycloclasticus sp. 46_83_sub15_T18]|nr:flavoprotein [Cycloclasticus sp. 46_83_sub15_T18]OUR82186.1 flavoprotein [Cycloclasticus sp. 46_120_T64]